MAEIFVKFGDRDSQGRGRSGEKSVLFLLHMDALGDIVAEAKIQTGKIRCVLKCRDKEICNFMKPSLGELGKRLAALGYDIECLECVTQRMPQGHRMNTVDLRACLIWKEWTFWRETGRSPKPAHPRLLTATTPHSGTIHHDIRWYR
ncbi:MAG: hypothetical protein JRE40_04485 [Deltaproteobacteria bacterium]|nr:hypothetical protein [Deltaproteobacteria bacterium]